MSEAVAVPNVVSNVEVVRESNPQTSGQVLDEGLDLSSYRGTHQIPYVADYFGVKELYGANEGTNKMVDSITEYLINQTPNQSMVFVVKQILDGMAQELNLKEEDAGLYKLKRVHKMIEIKQRLDMVEKMRQQALADIENIS